MILLIRTVREDIIYTQVVKIIDTQDPVIDCSGQFSIRSG